MTRNLKNWEHLLAQAVGDLHRMEKYNGDVSLCCIEVVLYNEDGIDIRTMSLVRFLDTISSDLYWDEAGDFSGACTAEVRTI